MIAFKATNSVYVSAGTTIAGHSGARIHFIYLCYSVCRANNVCVALFSPSTCMTLSHAILVPHIETTYNKGSAWGLEKRASRIQVVVGSPSKCQLTCTLYCYRSSFSLFVCSDTAFTPMSLQCTVPLSCRM